MRKLLFCAAAFLTPSLLASETNFSQHELNQLECSNSHEITTQSLSFNDLPIDIKRLVLQHVPLGHLLVCHDWLKITEKRRALELKAFLEKLKFFEMNFNSDKVKNEVGYIERHFNTPGEMYWMISKVIASYYDKAVESVMMVGNSIKPGSLKDSASQKIEAILSENRLITKLPNLLLKSENHKRLLFDLLSGDGNFCEIPLRVRQLIAGKFWRFDMTQHIHPLYSFLSSFHDKFDMLKDSLVDIPSNIVAKSCVKFVLGINCTRPSVDDQTSLFGSMKLLFPNDSLIQKACLFCEELLPDSSVSQIIKVINKYPSLEETTFSVLQSSSEHTTAMWCMEILGNLEEPNLPSSLYTNPSEFWLFRQDFLTKYGLLRDQLTLLKECDASDLFWTLPPDLTGVDTQALVKWVNEDVERKGTLSLDNLVILYSLDNDDDSLSKYSESLQKFKEKLNDLFYFSSIALGVECGQHLHPNKRAALLQLLYPEESKKVVTYLSGDRKPLVFKVYSLLDKKNDTKLVERLPKSDFSLLVEACLEHSATCNVRPLYYRKSELAVQVLLKYIGDDVKKAADLQGLPKYYQAMVFLLIDSDEIANYVIESGKLDYLNWNKYFPNIRSDWKAIRAAKRIHEYQQRHPQQRQ